MCVRAPTWRRSESDHSMLAALVQCGGVAAQAPDLTCHYVKMRPEHQEEDAMRLKDADSPVLVAESRLHIRNAVQRDRNRNRASPTGGDGLGLGPPLSQFTHSNGTQWANNYDADTQGIVKHSNNFNNNNSNNNVRVRQRSNHSIASSGFMSESSPDDSIGDYEDSGAQSSSHEDERSVLSASSTSTSISGVCGGDGSDSGDDSDSGSSSSDGNCRPPSATAAPGGIVNPNYPGFQHLAAQAGCPPQADSSEDDCTGDEADEDDDSVANNNNDNNNNNHDDNNNREQDDEEDILAGKIDSINHLDSVENLQKASLYDKPKFNIPVDAGDSEQTATLVKDLNVPSPAAAVPDMALALAASTEKMGDAFLSGAKEDLSSTVKEDSNRAQDDSDGTEKFALERREKDEVPRKKEKMEEINYCVKKQEAAPPAGAVVRRRDGGVGGGGRSLANRRSVPAAKKRTSPEVLGGFDVYNIETAMPKIDLDAIESHLRAAREEERRRRNDREEIRRRLAMGSDTDDYYGGDRPGRKPSLQARLQSVTLSPPGMNLQICFMNETASDVDSPSSDTETSTISESEKMSVPRSQTLPTKQCTTGLVGTSGTRPSTSLLTLPLRPNESESDTPLPPQQPLTEADFFARQARLQAEARLALAQAKEMAHMQMEVERQRQKKSPITEMVRSSLEKVGIPFPEDRRRVSRQLLTEMNVAQLQVIVNDLHTQIEVLNEGLVKFLMDRDDLHMEQDSMLVDIEDLTRYLGAKEQTVKEKKDVHLLNQNNNLLSSKPKINRIASLVKK